MVGGSGSIATDDGGGPSQPVQALVVAVTTTWDATEDPLRIRAGVKAVANSVPNTASMLVWAVVLPSPPASLTLWLKMTIPFLLMTRR